MTGFSKYHQCQKMSADCVSTRFFDNFHLKLSTKAQLFGHKSHLSPNMTSEMQPSKAGGGVRLRPEDSSGGSPPRNSPPLSGAWISPVRRGSWPFATTMSETRSCRLRAGQSRSEGRGQRLDKAAHAEYS